MTSGSPDFRMFGSSDFRNFGFFFDFFLETVIRALRISELSAFPNFGCPDFRNVGVPNFGILDFSISGISGFRIS